MEKILLILAALLFCTPTQSQEIDLSSLLISKELTKNANAVIKENSTEVTIDAVNLMHVKKKRIITILNKFGNRAVDTYVHYNNDTKITGLSAKIYNSLGVEIKKYSKSKFIDVSAVDGGTLYSDSRVKYIDYTPTQYPYTVVFECEYKTSSTGFIPSWHPLTSFLVSVKKSEFKINNPKNLEIRTKEINFKNFPIKKVSNESIHYLAENIPAIKPEKNSIAFIDLIPSLMISLNNFTLKGVKGKANNWKEYGIWMNNSLLKDKIILSDATIAKAKNLVKGIDDNIEKAKILYKFMQEKTRYISVQVGIGGLEPIPASEVDKLGYGDCKGLTNYTKALFNAAGVTSYYSEIYAGNSKRNIDKDFFSIQGDHVILNIPNNGKDIWLECTNQNMPFGFLGDFTDDRDALVITPEGGVIKRTPAYKNETNIQTTKATISITKEGNVSADIEIISKGIQYDNKFPIETKSKDELKKYYKSNIWDYNNNLEVNTIDITNDKENIIFKEKLAVTIKDYATLTDNELLFRLNVFNKNSFIPKRYRTRKLPLKIDRGYKDVDEYTIKLPSSYKITQLPQKKELNTKFGNYTFEVKKIDENTISYSKSILIKEGVYTKEDYKLYRKFRKSIAKQENLRIALQKQ